MGQTVIQPSHHVSVGAIVYRIVHGEIEVLAMHRTKTNSWHLPKGTRNENERLEETAEREVLEETGYPIAIMQYLGPLESTIERDFGTVPKVTHYFAAKPTSDTPQQKPDAEHDVVQFIRLQELKKLLAEKRVGNFEKEYLILETFLASGVLS